VIQLHNPSRERAEISYKVSNPQNFQVYPKKILLEPYSKSPVEIHYIPSKLNELESASIDFISSNIGMWRYQVKGIGVYPTKYVT